MMSIMNMMTTSGTSNKTNLEQMQRKSTVRMMKTRGMKEGIIAGLTGRVRRSQAPQVLKANELQAEAWNQVGRAIRKAMQQ